MVKSALDNDVQLLRNCAVCGSGRSLELFRENIGASAPWSTFISCSALPTMMAVLMCRACGWVYKNPTYETREVDALYSQPNDDQTTSDASAESLWRHRSQAIWQYLEADRLGGRRVVDVGGGRGELLYSFVRSGWECTVVDLSTVTALPGIRKEVMGFSRWTGRADVVVMSHVLEHVADPVTFLRYAHSALERNGLVYVEVPFELHTPLLRRHLGDHRHLGYFNRSTLRAVCARAGFSVLRVTLVSDYVGANKIALLRAVGRKTEGATGTESSPAANIRDLFHPLPWVVGSVNRLRQWLARPGWNC